MGLANDTANRLVTDATSNSAMASSPSRSHQRVVDPPSTTLRRDQPGLAEHSEMMRQQARCRARRLGELAHTAGPTTELGHHAPPNRITQDPAHSNHD